MRKSIGIYLLSFTLLSFLGYFLHNLLLSEAARQYIISLNYAYTFFGIFSLLLCIIILFLSEKEKFKDQLGFLYLASVAVKIILFCLVFNKYIFTKDSFSSYQAINLLTPIVLTLALEVFFISKILNNLDRIKNVK